MSTTATFRVHVELVIHICAVIVDVIKVICLGVPALCYDIFRTFVPRPLRNVSDRLVVITGGGNGLGRALAYEFADKGCRLAVVDIDLKAAEATCEELKHRRSAITTKAYRVDVSSFEQVKQFAETVEQDLGPVDILVNNAGLVRFGFIEETSYESADSLIDVNVKSHIWMTKAFIEGMMQRKRGHIVGISSMSGMYAFPWGIVYSATKFAVSGFMAALTEQLRIQGLSRYIKTTCINPYYISTRKDIVDFLQKPRFSPLTVEESASNICKGILRNDVVTTVPLLFGVFARLMLLFPVSIQQLIRDHIMREYELHNLT